MYKLKLNKELFNSYNSQNNKYFMILDSDLYNGNKVQNTVYLLFSSNIMDIVEDNNTNITDNDSGIRLSASGVSLGIDTKLEVNEIIDEDTKNIIEIAIDDEDKIYKAFDISLYNNDNIKKQPFGYVTISIPVPGNMKKDNLIVYRIDNDGNKITYDVEIKDGYAVFSTNHFSNYVLVGDLEYINGDMNKNGKIDLKDVILLIKKYLGSEDTNEEDISIGDMNENGKLDLKDVIILIKTYLGVGD